MVGLFYLSEELVKEVLHLPDELTIVAASFGPHQASGPPVLSLYVRHPSLPSGDGVIECEPIVTTREDGTVLFELNPRRQ